MSLFEILDLIIYNACVKLTSRKVKPQVINVRSLDEEQL